MKGKNFSEQLKNKGISTNDLDTIADLLMGREIMILSNRNGHNYGPANTRVTIAKTRDTERLGMGGLIVNHGSLDKADGDRGNNIYFNDFVLLLEMDSAFFDEEIAKLEKRKKEIDATITEFKDKQEFLKESGLQLFEESDYKASRLLGLALDSSLTKQERIAKIAEAISK